MAALHNFDMLLGPEMQAFHTELAAQQQAHPQLRLHYVTAWEMAQLVRQAEAGETIPKLSASTRFQVAPSGEIPARVLGAGARK